MKRLMNSLLRMSLALMLAATLAPAPQAVAAKKDAALADGLYAKFETSRGEIIAQLYYKQAPVTVANFAMLAEGTKTWRTEAGAVQKKPFYNGTVFHRVIPDFMIQGGDPTATGRGGPGYQFKDEFSPLLRHDRPGVLSMANAGPGTNGSQFFITHVLTPWLDGKHTIFGQVVQGQDVVNAIQQGDKLLKVTIIRVGKEAQKLDLKKAALDKMAAKGWKPEQGPFLD